MSDRANIRIRVVWTVALMSHRRQRGGEILLVGTEGCQNRMHGRTRIRRHRVLQERGQSTGRADVDVSASALLLQSRYGFAEANRAAHDTPEKVFGEVRQNCRLIAAYQRQSARLAPDRPHKRRERAL